MTRYVVFAVLSLADFCLDMPGIHELVTPASLYSFIVAGVLLLAWEAPLLGNRSIAAIELAGARFAARKKLAIFLIALLPILLRVLLLPIYPLRPPGVQDEFSYLFAADTFAHGHLANPPNPMWVYFDTIHILQHPVVASKYPPGQGAVLALGQLLGHPWIGVLLSMGAMFGALLWMLQGWFPAKWALLGAVLALLRFGVFSYWMNSYLGGAVAAFGGALVMGAYPRWLIHHRRRYAFILGVGAAILANSRPFEGFVLCVPVSVALMWWLSRNRDVPWREVSSRLFIPLGTVMLVASSFTLYYDWRITGNPFLFPHSLDTRIHWNIPIFFWDKMKPPLSYMNPQFSALYVDWARAFCDDHLRHFWHYSWLNLLAFKDFFLGAGLLIPLLALPSLLRARRTRFLVVQFLLFSAAIASLIWFNLHYIAPAVATLFALLLQMIRYLRRWEFRGRPVGIGLTRAVVLLTSLSFSICFLHAARHPDAPPCPGEPYFTLPDRAQMLTRLQSMPGEHLVIVRYSEPKHNPVIEWVYNAADVDHAKVVWAREIPGISLQPLLEYYNTRSVWLVEADASPARLVPYAASLPPSDSHQGVDHPH